METKFKRVQEAIQSLKNIKNLNKITENGLEYLYELETLMNYVHSSLTFEEKETPAFEDWLKTFKQVDGKLYQYDNYRTYCHSAMLEQYRHLMEINF